MSVSLEDFRRCFGWNPYHFWGLANDDVPVESKCNIVVRKYSWQQSKAAGRNEIARGIRVAEARLREHLNFSVGKRFIEETLDYPSLYDPRMSRGLPLGANGRRLNVRLSEGFVHALGPEMLVFDGVGAVVLSDQYNDGLIDTFTFTIPTTITDESEVAVYFAAADRLDSQGPSDEYLIEPLEVSINAGMLTVTGRSWLIIRPILYEGVTKTVLDPAVVGNYATTLEVYQRSAFQNGTDASNSQVVLIWNTLPYPPWAILCCDDLSFPTGQTDPASEAFVVGRAAVRNFRRGEIVPGQAALNTTNGLWSDISWSNGCREPDKILVRYQAGVDKSNLKQIGIHGEWEEIVCRLAAAEVGKPICACEGANKELHRWQYDRARVDGANDEIYRTSLEDLNNPFGTRAGMIYAWHQVKNLGLTRSVIS